MYHCVEGSCDGMVGGSVVIEGGAASSYDLRGLEEQINYSIYIVVHSHGNDKECWCVIENNKIESIQGIAALCTEYNGSGVQL